MVLHGAEDEIKTETANTTSYGVAWVTQLDMECGHFLFRISKNVDDFLIGEPNC